MYRLIAAGCMVGAVVAINAAETAADCDDPSPASLLNDSRIAAMFSGVLRTVESVRTGRIIAFDVDVVWKGTVPRFAVVYNYIEPPVCWSSVNGNAVEGGCAGSTSGGATHALIPGARYFVATHSPLTALEREQFGLDPDAPLLGLRGCNGTNSYDLLAKNGLIRSLGAGREPQ